MGKRWLPKPNQPQVIPGCLHCPPSRHFSEDGLQSCIVPMRSCKAPTCGVAATCSLACASGSPAIVAACLSRGADAEQVSHLLWGDGPVSDEPAQVVQTGGQLLAVISGGTALWALQQQSQTAFQVALCMPAADLAYNCNSLGTSLPSCLQHLQT